MRHNFPLSRGENSKYFCFTWCHLQGAAEKTLIFWECSNLGGKFGLLGSSEGEVDVQGLGFLDYVSMYNITF